VGYSSSWKRNITPSISETAALGPDLYRIRDFVPDFEAIAAETAARSRETTARSLIWASCAYGTGVREKMDILLPRRLRGGAPLHMFVHGGYWRAGNKADFTCVAEPVLAAGGIAAIVEYDLMPGTRLDVIVGQVRRAARWLAEQARGLGADPARFTVSGHSAGAHLASLLAATGPHEQGTLEPLALQGLLLVSGIYDLSGIPGSFLRHEAEMRPDEAEAWSPLSATQHAGPLRVITVGANETLPFHTQATHLHGLLQRQGMASELRCEPGLNHMNVVLDLADPEKPLGRRLAGLVENA
jgi:arylformamidase